MNDQNLPPVPPGDYHNYQQPPNPKELSSGAKLLFTLMGGGYSSVAAVISAVLVGNNFVAFGIVIGVAFLSMPIASFFFKGFRFFGLGASLAIVFGCLLPFAAIFVICGGMAGHL